MENNDKIEIKLTPTQAEMLVQALTCLSALAVSLDHFGKITSRIGNLSISVDYSDVVDDTSEIIIKTKILSPERK
jgi:hypothetical protein